MQHWTQSYTLVNFDLHLIWKKQKANEGIRHTEIAVLPSIKRVFVMNTETR